MDGQSLQPRSHRRPEPRTSGRRPTKDHGSHVLDHLNVLYKYRHVAISVFLLVVLGVLLRTYTTVPLYRAQARLMIELEDERTAAIAGAINTVSNNYWQDPQVYYETQYRILTGRELGAASFIGSISARWRSSTARDRRRRESIASYRR